ncbi:MAG: hypothetical protein LUH03_03740 [Oscillospiraceae bacterium]|nr:hypothetical protein [Oscillospiraceae bacterium]
MKGKDPTETMEMIIEAYKKDPEAFMKAVKALEDDAKALEWDDDTPGDWGVPDSEKWVID